MLDGLERIGRPPKAAFFLRYDTGDGELLPFRRRATRRFTHDPEDKDADTFQIEMFAGGGGAAQIGAFGPHSHHPDGSVALEYRWVGDFAAGAAARRPAGDRPERDVRDHRRCRGDLRGGRDEAGSGDAEEHTADKPLSRYDLTPETVFEAECHRHGTVEVDRTSSPSWSGRPRSSGGPRVRVTGSFTGDPTSKGSLRGLVSIGRGGITIVDTKTGITHRPAKADPSVPLSDEFAAELQAIFDAFRREA